MKSMKVDSSGIGTLKTKIGLSSDSKAKAEALNTQFASVFTKENLETMPDIDQQFPNMPTIDVRTNGVHKLLKGLKPHKAAGPDGIPARVLKECADEIAPIL